MENNNCKKIEPISAKLKSLFSFYVNLCEKYKYTINRCNHQSIEILLYYTTFSKLNLELGSITLQYSGVF